MFKLKQDYSSDRGLDIVVVVLVMLYISLRITCNILFFRPIDFHIPIMGYQIKVISSVFLYPLLYVICDLLSVISSKKLIIVIILTGTFCDGLYSFLTYIISTCSLPHLTKPNELNFINAANLIAPRMWVLYYKSVLASIITTFAEVILFTFILKKIRNINFSIIISVATVIIVHNLILNYPMLKRYGNASNMIISGATIEIIFLIFYTYVVSFIKKIMGSNSFKGSTTMFANNITSFIKKLSDPNKGLNNLEKNLKEVAHNIQSPILILSSVVNDLEKGQVYKNHVKNLKEAVSTIQLFATEMLEKVRTQVSDSGDYGIENTEQINVCLFIRNELLGKYIEYNKIFSLDLIDKNPEKEHYININPFKFKQIFSNLLNNAKDALIYSEDKKEIIIEVSELNNIVEVSIINFGNILPPEKIDDAMSGLSSKHSGKGVGLLSAIEYLESINSKLLITSSSENGTKVTIRFNS